MKFGAAIKSFFKNYATFSGRARRSEYWYSVLFIALVQTPFSVVSSITSPGNGISERYLPIYVVAAIAYLMLAIALIAPALAVTVRRLHDTGRSAWYFMWYLLPLVGAIIFLVALFEKSNEVQNKYGNPVK